MRFPVCRCGAPRTPYNAGELVVWNKVVCAALAGSTGVQPGTEPATWTPVETCAELGAKEGAQFEDDQLAKDPNEPGDPTSLDLPAAPKLASPPATEAVRQRLKNGSSAGKPATLEYDQPATGPLRLRNDQRSTKPHVKTKKYPLVQVSTTGRLRTMGYEGLEVINSF